MIRRLPALPDALGARFAGQEAALLRIESAVGAYGAERAFLALYAQTADDAPPEAPPQSLLLLMDGEATLLLTPQTRAEELAALLRALGCASVFAQGEARLPGFSRLERAAVLRRDLSGEIGTNGVDWSAGSVQTNPSPRALYPLFAEAFPGALPPFDAWYADVSHRQRHGFAHSVLLRDEAERPAACALALTAGDRALLSGICCKSDLRGRGLGGAALESLCGVLRRAGIRRVSACAADSARPFYLQRGFFPAGECARYA